MAGVLIDEHGCDVGAVRVGVILGLPVDRGFQAFGQFARQGAGAVGFSGHVGPGDVAVGYVLDAEAASLQGHVLGIDPQQTGSDLGRFFSDDLAGLDKCAAPYHQGAAGPRAHALGHHGGVAVEDLHVFHGHSQFVADYLGKDGLVPLPVGRRTGYSGDLPRRFHANDGALVALPGAEHAGRAKARTVNVGGYAYAHQSTLVPQSFLLFA